MDSELLSDESGSEPERRGDTQSGDEPAPFLHSKLYEEAFPYYLSIGMTVAQYWDDDVNLTKYYREAQILREEQINKQLWLQGMYIYEAVCAASPIFNAFAKKGTKPHPYAKKPYDLGAGHKRREEPEAVRQKRVFDKGLKRMEEFMAATNARFMNKKNTAPVGQDKEVSENG